jgi:hypothetical protein
MIMPSDKDYKVTKLIKQGKRQMNSDFDGLANWIFETYNVKPINILYDEFRGYKNILRPRLQIVFEYEKEERGFRDEQFNFDENKQVPIKAKFEQTLIEKGLLKESTVWDFFKKIESAKYRTDDLWVIFSAFDRIAQDEANSAIPEEEIEKLKNDIDNPDLWLISKFSRYVIFFFYTDNQIETYSLNGLKQAMTDKYFDILKKYDEFDYFKRDQFSIKLDSKENFDNNYQSNWFYYYK